MCYSDTSQISLQYLLHQYIRDFVLMLVIFAKCGVGTKIYQSLGKIVAIVK